ncbi:MAG: thermonuclease family protein [candidate division KSB1 bacterium]|nr:thermonuclease family protein [candidate division KSB1 bacterium]
MRQAVIFITLLMAWVLVTSAYSQARQPCAISRVLDSCRLELASGEIIRLIGLQAFPNFSSNRIRSDAFMDSLILGHALWLEQEESWPAGFGYFWRDSLLINAELLRAGLARLSPDTVDFRYRQIFLAAETEAKTAQRGYWASTLASLDSTQTTISWLEDSVYITPSGQRYHRLGCRFLSAKRIALPLSKVRVEYAPCRLCIEARTAEKSNIRPRQSEKTSTAACAALTQSGSRCKRRAEPPSKYCWQHRSK